MPRTPADCLEATGLAAIALEAIMWPLRWRRGVDAMAAALWVDADAWALGPSARPPPICCGRCWAMDILMLAVCTPLLRLLLWRQHTGDGLDPTTLELDTSRFCLICCTLAVERLRAWRAAAATPRIDALPVGRLKTRTRSDAGEALLEGAR